MADNDFPTGDLVADSIPSDTHENRNITAVTPQDRAGGYQVGLGLELEP